MVENSCLLFLKGQRWHGGWLDKTSALHIHSEPIRGCLIRWQRSSCWREAQYETSLSCKNIFLLPPPWEKPSALFSLLPERWKCHPALIKLLLTAASPLIFFAAAVAFLYFFPSPSFTFFKDSRKKNRLPLIWCSTARPVVKMAWQGRCGEMMTFTNVTAMRGHWSR